MLSDSDIGVLKSNPLSQEEREFLGRGGALVADMSLGDDYFQLTKSLVVEYENMVTTALTPQEVAARLYMSIDNVHKMTEERSIYAFDSSRGRIYPIWQFYSNNLLPNLKQVLVAINKKAHPLSVQRFFITKTADLKSDISGSFFSTREWLVAGYPTDEIIRLAGEL